MQPCRHGEDLYPRKWNNEFIDLPEIRDQRTPSFTGEELTQIVASAKGQFRLLYSLLGGARSANWRSGRFGNSRRFSRRVHHPRSAQRLERAEANSEDAQRPSGSGFVPVSGRDAESVHGWAQVWLAFPDEERNAHLTNQHPET